MKLLFILGPRAVGKMSIGQELAKKTSFKLFHNHHSIELALDLFWYGSPEFKAINEGIRQLVFDTCAKSKNLKGLILYCWILNHVLAKDARLKNLIFLARKVTSNAQNSGSESCSNWSIS